MLDGNKVKFGEIVADLMADRADAAVTAFRDDYEQVAFNFDEDLEDDDDDDEDLSGEELDDVVEEETQIDERET